MGRTQVIPHGGAVVAACGRERAHYHRAQLAEHGILFRRCRVRRRSSVSALTGGGSSEVHRHRSVWAHALAHALPPPVRRETLCACRRSAHSRRRRPLGVYRHVRGADGASIANSHSRCLARILGVCHHARGDGHLVSIYRCPHPPARSNLRDHYGGHPPTPAGFAFRLTPLRTPTCMTRICDQRRIHCSVYAAFCAGTAHPTRRNRMHAIDRGYTRPIRARIVCAHRRRAESPRRFAATLSVALALRARCRTPP